MSAPVVLLDACVLYQAALRDLLMWLAVRGLVHAKWSARIHEEWITAVLRERTDLTRAKPERTRTLMDLHGGDCIVDGYEDRIEALTLPDPGDRHVLAAGLKCGAKAIVTWNLTHFPQNILRGYGIAVWTPDELLGRLLASNHNKVVEVMREHRESLKEPPKSPEEYLGTLLAQRLAILATKVTASELTREKINR